MNCYIFDIDGTTIADGTHRVHHILKEPKDWRTYFAACGGDAPIKHIIRLARDLHRAGAYIAYVSDRSDECERETVEWMREHKLPPGKLYMRKAGDHRNDDVLKAELLGLLKADGYEPIMAFDDRNRVVAAWRANGIPCAQVADGDL